MKLRRKSFIAWLVVLVAGYNGRRLIGIAPTSLDREILDAMAAHDDAGGWIERTLRDSIWIARFFIYYLLLIFLAGIMFFWRRAVEAREYGRRGVE